MTLWLERKIERKDFIALVELCERRKPNKEEEKYESYQQVTLMAFYNEVGLPSYYD